MLSREQANEQMAEQFNEDWMAEALARAEKLGGKKRDTATTLLEDRNDSGYSESEWQEEMERRLAEAALFLDEASPNILRSVLETCQPMLGHDLANWWAWARSNTPLQNGQLFPGSPELTRRDRILTLRGLIMSFGGYPADALWVARWTGHRGYYQSLADLLLVSIEEAANGDEIFETLIQTIKGEHPTAAMGEHVLQVLTRAPRPQGWEMVEGMLIGAQRQESLRASILGCVPKANPEAFRRLLRLLVEQKMLRFGAVLRAVGEWVGIHTSAEDEKAAAGWLQTLIDVSDLTPEEILKTDSAVAFELGLDWLARRDGSAAFDVACQVLDQPDRERAFRILAAQWLSRSGIPNRSEVLESLVDDSDPWISAAAIGALRFSERPSEVVFEATERLLDRWPDEPITNDYSALRASTTTFDRTQGVWSLLVQRGELAFSRLEPWLDEILRSAPTSLIYHLRERKELEAGERQLILDLTGDRRKRVRLDALSVLSASPLASGDAEQLEPLLCSKTEAVRRAVIRLLADQQAADVVASVRRLWFGTDRLSANQLSKDAAAELLSLVDAVDEVSALATELLAEDPSNDRAVFLRAASGAPDNDEALNPRFGLFVEADRTPAVQPKMPTGRASLLSANAAELLLALDELVEEHQDVEVLVRNRRGGFDEVIFGDLRTYPGPFPEGRHRQKLDPEERPLKEVFDQWWNEQGDRYVDADGLGVLRALVLLENSYYSEDKKRFLQPSPYTVAAIGELEPVMLRHRNMLGGILDWFLVLTLSSTEPEQLLKLMQAECSFVTDDALQTTVPPADQKSDQLWRQRDVRYFLPDSSWKSRYFSYRQYLRSGSDDEQFAEMYRLLRWLQQPLPASEPHAVPTEILFAAHQQGLATNADVFDKLLGLSARLSYDGQFQPSEMLKRLTAHDRLALIEQFPKVVAVADRIRDRVLEIELQRGELPTAATRYVQVLGCIEGAELVFDLLSLLGSDELVRGWTSHESKTGMVSKLLRNSFPLADDTGSKIKRLATQRGVGTQRLVELAIYAPQWSAQVEDAVGWRGLSEAVWWLHAHTKDRQWSVEVEVRETWRATIAQMTALTPEDLMDGAVDVDWFRRFHSVLKAKRWSVVYEAGKLSSSGVGHNRAKLFADAMLGELDQSKVVKRIEQKRHQDSVRALGLLPLPKAKRVRSEELLYRYSVIRTFEKGPSKFGNQRKASERLAARVGLDNLARTAGYDDPQRFGWAMEEAGIADLKKGPVVVSVDDVTVTLAIDDEGVATISVARAGRPLKSVPVKLRKNPDVMAVKARQTELASQVSRVRASLEQAMIRADAFTEVELVSLIRHPIVGPMLRLLVIADRRGSLGLPTADGFVGPTARRRKLQEPLHIAHATDLLESGEWQKWQAFIIDQERRQPFKQVFRELYLPTETERGGDFSKRYDGHQVQPSQARALLGQRGWYHSPDSGMFSITNHAADVVSHLELGIGLFAAHDGELPVVGNVTFGHRRGGARLGLADVPAHVFSETMRDVDLVVSVAHAGGVDPETSQSTVEMRTALARETARVLRLTNVEFTKTHAMILGTIAEYSLHLGSGVAHRRPGAALAIQAAPSQRRGRIFLPFADDDPKTAEILSKLLLLARDDEIQDPSILRQIR